MGFESELRKKKKLFYNFINPSGYAKKSGFYWPSEQQFGGKGSEIILKRLSSFKPDKITLIFSTILTQKTRETLYHNDPVRRLLNPQITEMYHVF